MASQLDMTHSLATDMSSWGSQSAVSPQETDLFGNQETTYMNTEFQQQWAYFLNHPELKQAILMKAIYTVGKGYTCENAKDKVLLDLIQGRGKSSFDDILFNMEIMRYATRDSYAEIVKDEKTGMLLNLIPLNGGAMRHVYDKKGVLIADVERNSPAEEVGLQRGDIIKEIDKKEVNKPKDLQDEVRKHKEGDTVVLLIYRDNHTVFVTTKLGLLK